MIRGRLCKGQRPGDALLELHSLDGGTQLRHEKNTGYERSKVVSTLDSRKTQNPEKLDEKTLPLNSRIKCRYARTPIREKKQKK